MKKLLLAFGALFAISFVSCTGDSQQKTQELDENDSTEVVDSALLVSGIAVDGAMNSVYLKVGDDTVEFSYPDLESDHRQSWEMGDSLTIRYYVTEGGDSVTDVINDTNA
jgi:hypothetical protein